MDKLVSKKVLPWTKTDIVKNVVVYALNTILIVALLILGAYINNYNQMQNGFVDFIKNWQRILNFFVLVVFLMAAIFLYFYFESRDFLKSAVNSEMIFLIIEIGLCVCFLSGNYINTYIRPLALVAILVLFLKDSKTAIFINIIFCILLFIFDIFVGNTYSETSTQLIKYEAIYFIIVGVLSGTLAVYILREVFSRMKLLLLSMIISVPVMVGIALPILEFGGQNILVALLSGFASGPLAASLFIIFLPIFESIFIKTSSFKLNELTSHHSVVIRSLISQAPGTFNHSIVVSNIAEACATAIGEDALLARTCAYYHDIGKLRRPEFFKENQSDGLNPHDDLTPELSSNIIKSHTEDGYKLALKNRIPLEIANVIREHHGTMPILYFYDKAKKYTDGEVSINQYCYSGPKPQSKIAAIIMIADGCEAATRTLADRSKESVESAVKKIVQNRMDLGQFDDCEITLKELNIIISAVVNSLTGIYHNRIEYPKVSIKSLVTKEEAIEEESTAKPKTTRKPTSTKKTSTTKEKANKESK